MHYEGNIIRPPSEANSIILQVTVGCSHNRCTFCGTYKDVRFQIKKPEIIDADLRFAATYCQRLNKVFLADGDVLILPQDKLVRLFMTIRDKLPWVNRISLYANEKSIRHKTPGQLAELKTLGLDRIYLGLESGHDETLQAIRKGAAVRAMIESANKVRDTGIFLSVTVLLGIGGVDNSIAHARATGEALSLMRPNQIGVLTLMLLPNTPLYQRSQQGDFQLPGPPMLLHELRVMVENITLAKTQLQTNHASNYLPINARLSRDKEQVLNSIDQAIAGEIDLVPEHHRAL